MYIYTIPRDKFFSDYMKQVLTSEAFEAFFIHGSIFDKAVFCLGENKVC